MSTASSVTPSPTAGREGELRKNILQPGTNMSAPLQTIHDRGQARGDQAQGHLGQLSNNAANYGNQAALYGAKSEAIGNNANANAQDVAGRLASAGGTGGAIGNQYAGGISQAGAAGMGQAQMAQGALAAQASKLGDAGDRLANLENTQGPSAAQAQLTSGLNRAQANNLAAARSGSGFGGSASRSTQALRQNSAMGQEAANQSAVLKAGEDAAWRQRQANNLAGAGNLYSGAGNLATAGGQLGLQATGQNLQGQQAAGQTALAGNAQNLQGIQAGGQMGLAGADMGLRGAAQGVGANQAGIQGMQAAGGLAGAGYNMGFQGDTQAGQSIAQDAAAKKEYEDILTQRYGISSGVDIQQNQASNAFTGQMIGAGTAAAGMMAMSDERQKVKLSSGTTGNPYGRRGAPGTMAGSYALSDERQKDFRNVEAEHYVYKDPTLPGAEPGEQIGPMAQDIEINHPDAIVEGPYGKMVRQDRLVLPLSSAVGELQKEVDALKKKRPYASEGD